jgi:peptide subunit release factor RF-3
MVDLFKLTVAISVGLLDEAAERANKEIEIPVINRKVRLEDAERFILFGGSLAADYFGLARFGVERDIVETVEIASAPLAVKSTVKIVSPIAKTYLGPRYVVREVEQAPAITAPLVATPIAPRITSY